MDALLTPRLTQALDVAVFMLPGDIPHSPTVIEHLKRTAVAHEAALVPAGRDEIAKELMTLSAATIPWQQTDRETALQFELVVAGLADIPLDILKDGCRRYMLEPGKRFFPRSPGELREFLVAQLHQRKRRVVNLHRLIAELETKAADERRREEAETSWTPESTAEANADFRRAGVRTRYKYVGGGRVETVDLAATTERP